MKRVKEKLYEKFEEHSDAVEDMGIGMQEFRELRKNYKEYEKFLDFKGDMDFTKVVNIVNDLRNIIAYYTIYYFNEKYKLNIKLTESPYGPNVKLYLPGGVFAEGRIPRYKLDFNLSNSGLSVSIDFIGSGQSTPRCKSIHALDAAFLKICKKLNISLK